MARMLFLVALVGLAGCHNVPTNPRPNSLVPPAPISPARPDKSPSTATGSVTTNRNELPPPNFPGSQSSNAIPAGTFPVAAAKPSVRPADNGFTPIQTAVPNTNPTNPVMPVSFNNLPQANVASPSISTPINPGLPNMPTFPPAPTLPTGPSPPPMPTVNVPALSPPGPATLGSPGIPTTVYPNTRLQ